VNVEKDRKRRARGLSGGAADGLRMRVREGETARSDLRANEQNAGATTAGSIKSYDTKAKRAALRRERVENTHDHEEQV
jgi:hypothetical protein